MNEYFIHQHRYDTVKTQSCVDWTERLKEHLQLPPKDTLMKKHTALKQNIKKTAHA